jgi:uncharacterized iron-regulated membrane protein
MSLKKSIGKLHLWLGLASGIIVLILSITGCIYVFIDQIKSLVYKDRLYVEVPASPEKLPLSRLKANAEKELGSQFQITWINVPGESNRTFQFTSYKAGNEKAITCFGTIDYHYTVYVNPYSGKVVYKENSKYEFFRIVFWIHWSLLLNTSIGQPVVGTAVIIFVIQLITGVILWWPRNRNAIKQRIWFKWKDSTKWKRKNYDLHNIPGFYTLFLALIIALTGLVWAFDWFKDSVQWTANGGKSIEKSEPVISDTTLTGNIFPLDKIILSGQLNYPTAVSYSVMLPSDKKSTVRVSIKSDKHAFYKNINHQYDQHSGKLLKASVFADKNAGEKIYALNYDIHVGGVLGLTGKILAFLASLICASLPVTGFFIWRGRKKI